MTTTADHRPLPAAVSTDGFDRRTLFRGLGVAAAAVLVPAVGLAAAPQAQAAAGGSSLFVGETLGTGQSLVSPNRAYQLVVQGDGNLVAYGPSGAIWASGTRGSNARLVLQGDGNCVMYADQGVLFATGAARSGSNQLVMQDDGNVVLYGSANLWASKLPYERAIDWFRGRAGATNYEGRCELAVENAFGRSGQYATARANWNARPQKFGGLDAPRGALVFYSTSSAGHVALSLGNGRILSSSVGGRIGETRINYFQNPLGWAYSPW